MWNREFNCIRYELPSVYTCNIKTSLLKYKLKWSCKFLLLGAFISSKGSDALHTQHQLPTFAKIFFSFFFFFAVKLRLFRKSSDVLLLGLTNITLVLRFKKSNKFYCVQTAKVVNSKEASSFKGSTFVHSEEFLPIFQILIF